MAPVKLTAPLLIALCLGACASPPAPAPETRPPPRTQAEWCATLVRVIQNPWSEPGNRQIALLGMKEWGCFARKPWEAPIPR